MSIPDSTTPSQPKTLQERLAMAEEREKKAVAHRDKLRRVSVAEAEVPSVWKTGEVTKKGLADTYGVSEPTISRILEAAGFPQTRFRRATDEERNEIVTLLKSGTTKEEIAEAYSMSVNTVRGIGLKAGVLRPGERKPQRSDEDYARITELNELAIQRFGSGLYNLGVGLRNWQRKQEIAARESQPAGEGSVAAALHAAGQPEPAHTEADAEPGYPQVSDGPEEGTQERTSPLLEQEKHGGGAPDDNFRFR